MHFISRREFLTLLSASLLLPWLPACQHDQQRKLRVAHHKWPCYELIRLDKDKLALQHIQLQDTQSGTESIQTLLDDRADAAMLTLDEVLRARAQGVVLSVVLVLDISAGADVILVKPPRPTLKAENLHGMRIGVEHGALGALMLSQFLQQMGLQHHEIKQVSLKPDQQEQAWLRNEIDALICYAPVSNRLEREGAIRIFDSRSLPNLIVDVLAVRQDVLHEQTQAVKQLVASYFANLQQLQKNATSVLTPIAQRLDISIDELKNTLATLTLPDVTQNRILLGGDTPTLLDSAKILVKVMQQAGLLLRADDLRGLLTAEML